MIDSGPVFISGEGQVNLDSEMLHLELRGSRKACGSSA